MTKKLKKQLFNSHYLIAFILLLVLSVFFIYAISFQNSFFIYIIAVLGVIIILLSYFHGRFIRKQAELDLKEQDYLEKSNLLEVEITEEWRAIQSFRKKIVNYSHLKDLTEKLSMSFSLEETTKTLSAEVNKIFGSDEVTAILYLFHSKTGELGVSQSQRGPLKMNLLEKNGDIYDQWIIKNIKPLLVEDARSDFRFDVNKIETESSRLIRSLMSIPLVTGNKMIGILRLDSLDDKYFSVEELRLLTTIGDLGAVAIENAQLYEKVEDLAVHDGLTGLFVKRHFLDMLSKDVGKKINKKSEASFLMVDLDHFKDYNDTYGHSAGDSVLKMVGKTLVDMFVAGGNLVCRYGGEEFLVFLDDCPKEQAKNIAEELRQKIENTSLTLRRKKTNITTSIGVASSSEESRVVEELIQKADDALYKAKKRGRNRVCVS